MNFIHALAMLDIPHLKNLRAIARAGSLTEAAAERHLTQSALSHQIRKLEDYFGIRLLERNKRGVRFTAAGQALLDLAEDVVVSVERAESALRRAAHPENRRLHIVLECHSCFEWLLPTMDAYREQWPGVALDLSLGHSFNPFPALKRGEIDLVISADPEPDPAIAYLPLFEYEVQLALHRTHPLLAQSFIQPGDLAAETVLVYPVCRSKIDLFSRFLDPAEIEPAQIRNVELTVMMLQLIANQRGVAALPSWALAPYRRNHYVETRPLGREGLWTTLYAAVRADDRYLDHLDAFVRLARDRTRETLDEVRAI